MTTWEVFFKEKASDMFTSSKEVIDIGGSLRLRGNVVSKKNEWLKPYIEKVQYKVLDPVPDYSPDIVGDIHDLPFEDDSIDAILCLAVLEHVENPIQAMSEMRRVLKPGGKLLLYVPFLYYYHAYEGYYGDYWRFTYDTMKNFAKPFSKSEMTPVRLPIETLIRLTPLGRYHFFISATRFLDRIFYSKKDSKQVSGYYLWLVK